MQYKSQKRFNAKFQNIQKSNEQNLGLSNTQTNNNLNNNCTHLTSNNSMNTSDRIPITNNEQSKFEIGHSTFVVNDNLINTFNPKRTSMDLNSFIQVFRKKMRQTTITKQFQNSIDKFKFLSLNKNKTNGFTGSYKKKNQLLVQNNIIDKKIKKIIISDEEYKHKKNSKFIQLNFNNTFNNNHMKTIISNNYEQPKHPAQSFKQNNRKVYTQSDHPHTFSQRQTYTSKQHCHTKPFQSIQVQKLTNLTQYNKNPQKSLKNSSSIFTNNKLQKITTYQKPNLMYNISLYKKRNSYNTLINKKKQHLNILKNNQKLVMSKSQRDRV